MGGTVHQIKIKSFKFDPEIIQVKVGDVIRWTNTDVAPHTATADKLGWDTQGIVKDESGEITVTADMETSYFCVYHPHMKGEIEIV
jgi:plastocyanin